MPSTWSVRPGSPSGRTSMGPCACPSTFAGCRPSPAPCSRPAWTTGPWPGSWAATPCGCCAGQPVPTCHLRTLSPPAQRLLGADRPRRSTEGPCLSMDRLTDGVELLDGPLDDPDVLAGNLRDLRWINRRLGGVELSASAIDALAAH